MVSNKNVVLGRRWVDLNFSESGFLKCKSSIAATNSKD
jgi:hypothetical protein